MEDRREKDGQDELVRFVPTTGSVIGGRHREKTARITEAMSDLQLGVEGLASRLAAPADGALFVEALQTFARTCSVFLRKTVLGDRGERETRLLDDRVLASLDLVFPPLRKISSEDRRVMEVRFSHAGGFMEVTKLNEETLSPEANQRLPMAPQGVALSIEWPLPGAADWVGAPSKEAPWPVNPEQLFDTEARPGLGCDEWLGQQVVLFDRTGISLKEIIRTVANFEGAHSISVGRLAQVEGDRGPRAARRPEPHLLSAISVFGVPYVHLIVIESALFLYSRLVDERSIERPNGEIYIPTPGFACTPDEAASSSPDWLRFEGGMMLSFSTVPTVIRHRLRAPN